MLFMRRQLIHGSMKVSRIRWRKFVHPGARRRFVLCRAALRSILCAELGCDNERLSFGEGEHGKPFALVDAIPAQISFNVSHSGNHGLIAVAPGGQLGVDVEEPTTRRDFDRLIEAAFGPNEQSDLKLERARGEFQLFFRLWTVKEALIKALGTGLSLDPATFEAPEENTPRRDGWHVPVFSGAVGEVARRRYRQ